LVGHVYSLVPLQMADHRLARQMRRRYCFLLFLCFSIIAWQSWFRRNWYFAFCLCITY